MIFYPYQSRDHSLSCFARCMGHGGMPLELASPAYPNQDDPQRVEYWDSKDVHPERFRKLPDGTVVGTNGYALMTIQGSNLSLEYLDADQTSLLKETFVPGGGAVWDRTLVRTVVRDPRILNQVTYKK